MASELAGLADQVNAAIREGTPHAFWAALQPDKVAVRELAGGRSRTFGELNANANRVARLLRAAGLGPEDAAAIVCSNRLEFAEVLSGAIRMGVRLTPVNWHMTAEEIAYVLQNCEAKAVFADIRAGEATAAAALECPDLALKIAIGGPIEGFADYEAALEPLDGRDLPDPVRGYTMLYTSGTTGRPKGVYRPNSPGMMFNPDYDRETDRQICVGPLYHAAPLGDLRRPLSSGVGVVLVDGWDAETVLRAISEYKITHGHFVATMFQRLLALPDEVKAKYDVSSLKRIAHGAAPTPPEVKRAMIDWWGPVLLEYYAGSEGSAGIQIESEEWLRKPGSVGRRPTPEALIALDDDGEPCPPGTPGTLYLRLPDKGGFIYYKDPGKTQATRRDRYFTMGDIGYFDEDDYLFLTGRSAETIISGGVNIYPQEIDNALIKHPAVLDCCTIGAPNDEWGEEVRAVIQLKAGTEPSEALKAEILAGAAESLARFKIPRGIDFAAELPRSDAGKILRNKVRAPYWEGRTRQI